MGESQSRYSIVERLTQRKLDIMTAKSELKEELKSKEQKIEDLKIELENWNEDVKEQVTRERRQKELEINNATRNAKNFKERMKDKEDTYDKKSEAVNEALKSIEEISKTAPNIQS